MEEDVDVNEQDFPTGDFERELSAEITSDEILIAVRNLNADRLDNLLNEYIQHTCDIILHV